MTPDPRTDRGEWLRRRDLILSDNEATGGRGTPVLGETDDGAIADATRAMEIAVGPCPPEQPPQGWHATPRLQGPGAEIRRGDIVLWAGDPHGGRAITADEAVNLGHALVRLGAWKRAQPRPKCSRILVGRGGDTYDPLCVLPQGHEGACSSRPG